MKPIFSRVEQVQLSPQLNDYFQAGFVHVGVLETFSSTTESTPTNSSRFGPVLKNSRVMGSSKKGTSVSALLFLLLIVLQYLFGLLTGNDLLPTKPPPTVTTTRSTSSTTPKTTTRGSTAPPYKPNCSYFNCDECGITYSSPNIKIIGGIPAVPHSWPAQAYLSITYDNYVYINNTDTYFYVYQQYSCGGTLINRDTVLSAAHCIITSLEFIGNDNRTYLVEDIPLNASMYKVYLGAHEIDKSSDQLEKNVRQVIPHPKYDEWNALNDISLLRLDGQVTLNDAVQIACLPDPNVPLYPTNWGEDMYAIGWGTDESESVSNVLKNVLLTLYRPENCSEVLPEYEKDWNSQICAGEWEGGKDTCQGDSGGGIYVSDLVNGQEKFIAAGIVSYGDGCALPEKPGIYTMISHFLPWINETFFNTME